MKNLKQLLKRLFCKAHVSKSLPDHYAGELNTKRIKAYKMLAEQYRVDESTVRDCFCKGADWYKEQAEAVHGSEAKKKVCQHERTKRLFFDTLKCIDCGEILQY